MTAPVLEGQVRTARVLAAARMRTLRTSGARAGAWVAFAAVCLLLAMSGSTGDLLREASRTELSDLLTIDQARAMLAWVVANPGGVIAVAAGFVLAAMVFTVVSAPGPGRLIDVPAGHLVPTGHLTRYLEHLATSLVSVVPAMQLVACVAAASLVTIDRTGRGGAMAVALLAWVAAQAASSALMWGITLYRRRRSGRTPTWTAAVVMLVLAAAAVAAVALGVPARAAAWALTLHPALWVPVLILLSAAFAAVGLHWCAAAGRLPVSTAASRRVRSTSIPDHPSRAVLAVTAVAAWRTPQVRAPLLTVVIASALGLALSDRAPQALAGAAIAVPIAWSLSFTANFLALHGRGALWLGTLARASHPLLASGLVVGLVGCLVPGLLALAPAALVGAVGLDQAVRYVLLLVAASFLLTSASLLLAVTAPQPATPGVGAPLLTPGRTLVTMFGLALLAGLAWLAVESPATVVGSAGVDDSWALVGLGICVVISAALAGVAWLLWPRLQSGAMSVAGAA